MEISMSLMELAEKAGASPRTIRYYISRNILDPPLKRGPNAVYGEKHLATLNKIKELQSRGLTLTQIEMLLASGAGQEEDKSLYGMEKAESIKQEIDTCQAPEISNLRAYSVFAYALGDEAILLLKSRPGPWKLKALIEAIQNILNK